jgi:molecular chaperone DnaK (HSP70)
MTKSRYLIGIDLGTTNCAVAYVDTAAVEPATEPRIELFRIPQVVSAGQVEPRDLLPSFLYLPGAEVSEGSLRLPWDQSRGFAVGEFARNQGAQVPRRLVSSAKSWLCHAAVDRRQPVLPFNAPPEVTKVSPVEAAARYLRHMKEAWNFSKAADGNDAHLFEKQEILLTVPASFDAVARELTVEAARSAGLEHITLLEEPQAAFYSWIQASGDTWRKRVKVGDLVLVCDIGGGTTDLSLIAVTEEAGNLVLNRIAVGDHILLGGDNMDIALAKTVEDRLAAKGHKLDAWQNVGLWYACRQAKEKMFANAEMAVHPVTLLGRGSSVIGGTIRTDLPRADLERTLLEGFFPQCGPADEPRRARRVGFQELGLPYAADAGITKHMAAFLKGNLRSLEKVAGPQDGRSFAHPTALLFNGGVLKAEPIRRRIVDVLNAWTGSENGGAVKVLEGVDLDLAVARGAAYYGLARRGKGVRIRGGAARTYYIGVESAMPAVPGQPPPMKAVCVLPYGTEEGTDSEIPGAEFGLVVGEPVEFPFLGSGSRRDDRIGTVLDRWTDDEVQQLANLDTALEPQPGQDRGAAVPVRLHSKVTEIGTLELYCISRDGANKWKLEFNVREKE